MSIKKAFGYLRVSTVGQAEEGYSLDHQKSAIQDYCKLHTINLIRLFVDEGKSGRTTNRPEFQEMLGLIEKKGINCVLIYKIDRFARNITDFSRIWNEFKEKGINLISVLEGDLSNGSSLVPNIFASVAQWESEVNSQRTKDALLQKFEEGWQPTPPVLGYQSVGGEGERKTFEPDPHTAPIIKKMFEMYVTGSFSINDLQEWLKDKNIISKNGTALSHSRINNILTNPIYYGLIRWNGRSKTGKHIPLISKQLFDSVQHTLAKHRHFLTRKRKYQFLLRGLAYCSCGLRLTADWHLIRSNKRRIGYYHCQKRYSPDCTESYVEVSDLEKQIEEKITSLKFSDEFIKAVQQQAKDFINSGRENTDSIKQTLINKKTGLEIKRNKLEDLIIEGLIDKDTYKRKHEEIQTRINNLEVQLEEANEENNLDVSLIEKVLTLTRNIPQTYKTAPNHLKRHYLHFFYDSFVVSDKKVVEYKPTPIFEALKDTSNVVRLRTNQLPG